MRSNTNCLKCEYFYVTWDKTSPKGCKYFGFKTKLLPSVAVQQCSGSECGAFLPKDIEKGDVSK